MTLWLVMAVPALAQSYQEMIGDQQAIFRQFASVIRQRGYVYQHVRGGHVLGAVRSRHPVLSEAVT